MINNELIIPQKGTDKSHYEWLLESGRTKDETDKIIKTELRGIIDPNGNIRFYVGENWEINEEIEEKFFKILPKLVKIFNIDKNVLVEGGAIKGETGMVWPSRKSYGRVVDLIK